MVHSVLVNRSKSSSEKSTGLSRELCRLGDRHASPVKKARSGSADEEEEDKETAGGAEEEVDVFRCSENEGSGGAAAVGAPASLSCIRPESSAEFEAVNAGGELCAAAASEEPDAPSRGGHSGQLKWPPSSGVGCALSPLSLA